MTQTTRQQCLAKMRSMACRTWIFCAALAAGCTGPGQVTGSPISDPDLPGDVGGRPVARDGALVDAAVADLDARAAVDTRGVAAGDAGDPAPAGVTVTTSGETGEGPIRAADTVIVRVTGPVSGTPAVEYYVEDLEKADHPTTTVALSRVADEWKASIPPQPDGAIVRYRIVDAGVAVSPGGNGWHLYFVTPKLPGKTFTYYLFIAKKNWSKCWTNIAVGRVPPKPPVPGGPPLNYECTPNPTYDDKVPAILATSEGEAVDISARYQGSQANRRNGVNVKTFPADKIPDGPKPFKALSWHFSIGGNAALAGKKDVLLIKRANECSMFTTGVGGQLFESVGIPASKVGVARLYVNGVYLHFYTEVEHADGLMLKRFHGKDHQIGDYFKASGWVVESGPFSWADGREFTPACGYSAAERYPLNYQRVTPKNKTGAAEVALLVHDLNVARAAGVPAMRAFFADNFALDSITTYVALINWLVPWDDFFQNYFLYRRTDGKWLFTPWDFDSMFGGYSPEPGVPAANTSFYIGEIGNRSNRSDVVPGKWSSLWKDSFIKAYRPELDARLKKMVADDLTPVKVNKLIDAMDASYTPEDAKTSATGAFCDPAPIVARMKKFVIDRNARVTLGLFN